MNRRKTGTTVLIAAVAAIGLILPGTAAARSYSPLQIGVQNTSMIVDIPVSASTSTDTVSWSDGALVEAVSWGD